MHADCFRPSKHFEVADLIKGKYKDNLEFMHSFKKNFEKNKQAVRVKGKGIPPTQPVQLGNLNLPGGSTPEKTPEKLKS